MIITLKASELKNEHACPTFRKRSGIGLEESLDSIHIRYARHQIDAINLYFISRTLCDNDCQARKILGMDRSALTSGSDKYIRAMIDKLITLAFSQADILFGISDLEVADAWHRYATRKGVCEWLKEKVGSLPFITARTAHERANLAIAYVNRYLVEEERSGRPTPFYVPKGKINLDSPAGTIEVAHPSFWLFSSINYAFGFNDTNPAFQAVRFKARKPEFSHRHSKNPKKNIQNSLETIAMMKMAEKAISYYGLSSGDSYHLAGSVFYLRHVNDTHDSLNEGFFTTVRFKNGRWNVAYRESGNTYSCIADVNEGKLDEEFENHCSKLVEGFLKGTQCDESICETCGYKNLCHFANPPIVSEEKAKRRSISDVQLSEAQQQVVSFRKGIARVNAGAGTGKTLVVALRTVFMLSEGIEPEKILLVTFTNSGAAEMKERILDYAEDFGMDRDLIEEKLNVTTFNSFGNDLVIKEYKALGFAEKPRLIDEIERKSIITKLLNDYPIDGLDYMNFEMSFRNAMGALSVVARCFDIIKRKNLSSYDAEILARESKLECFNRSAVEAAQDILNLYEKYSYILKSRSLIEYADQENLIFSILNIDPYYFDKLGYEHIIVDEYQDSSILQNEIVKRLIETSCFKSLLAVGDDSQSIFSFRDANPENIINFFDTFGRGEDIYMVENHRSTPEILELANYVNSHIEKKVDKDLVATRPSGVSVTANVFNTQSSNYKWIAEDILTRHENGTPYKDIVIQAGTKAELQKMASELSDRNIKSCIAFPEPMLEDGRIQGMLALCSAWESPSASKSVAELENAKRDGKLFDENDNESVKTIIEESADCIRKAKALGSAGQREWFDEAMKEIARDDSLASNFAERLARFRTVHEKIKYAHDFIRFGGEDMKRSELMDGVCLTTAHSAKGLEWPISYVIQTKFHGKNKDERLRLLFVAVTRARDELIITGTRQLNRSKEDPLFNTDLQHICHHLGVSFAALPTEADS